MKENKLLDFDVLFVMKRNVELQKQVDELKELNAKFLDSIESLQAGRCCFRCELTQQAVKDTAKEILKMVDEIVTGSQNDGVNILSAIKKHYGVEVE